MRKLNREDAIGAAAEARRADGQMNSYVQDEMALLIKMLKSMTDAEFDALIDRAPQRVMKNGGDYE